MNYKDKLELSSRLHNNCACMGIDPIIDDPAPYFKELFEMMKENKLVPAAFKPNLGYFSCLDRPRDADFSGSISLANILDMLGNYFPEVPVILDSKRGDIARSSLNYAKEAFDCWQADCVTISPYMGSDSVNPFAFEGKGAYILTRTSNPGGKDLQNLILESSSPLYIEVAKKIAQYNQDKENFIFGAVVGATNMVELENVAAVLAEYEIPMLIPGVGSQGGSATDVMAALRRVGYPLHLARINSSSAITHPWKNNPMPEDHLQISKLALQKLLEDTKIN